MARYYLTDSRRPLPASTEITGYAASAFVYLHSVTHDERYLQRARAQNVHISFTEYARAGVPLTVLAIAAGVWMLK